MTVLVVDDEVGVAELIQDQLEDEGHSCLTARDVEEAEWTIKAVEVHAMALDIEMPGTAPLDWLESLCLSGHELTRRTVVIAGRELTRDELTRIRACGATVLHKPFPIQDLQRALSRKLRFAAQARSAAAHRRTAPRVASASSDPSEPR